MKNCGDVAEIIPPDKREEILNELSIIKIEHHKKSKLLNEIIERE